MYHKKEKGFTLIELLVVVAILGILAAVVIPNVTKFMDKGGEEAKQTELHNIQTAVAAMMVDASATALRADGSGDGGSWDEVRDISTAGTPLGTDYVDEVCAGTGAAIVYLNDYFVGGEYPLKQSYDISIYGEVTLTPTP